MSIPDITIPPLKNTSYFGGSTYAPPMDPHKRKPVIWDASQISKIGPGQESLQDKWKLRKWGADAAGVFPADHPDHANKNFLAGRVADFFNDCKEFFNAGDLPNDINDHLLHGDVIVGKDIEGNLVRLVITEQHEIAAQGLIR